MTAYQTVIDALRANGRNVIERADGQASAQCPAHDDRSPSLSVTRIEGQALLYCHSGCTTDAVAGALGLTLADLYDDRRGATYAYADGRIVHRTADKKFRQSGKH